MLVCRCGVRMTLNSSKRRAWRATCKLCLFGIYEREAVVWLTKPMGQSHQVCAERAGLYPPA